MFLMSFANDFARLASIAAFLCLVVAHLECPDMIPQPSDDTILANDRRDNGGEPPFVHSSVADNLWMERDTDDIAAADTDD